MTKAKKRPENPQRRRAGQAKKKSRRYLLFALLVFVLLGTAMILAFELLVVKQISVEGAEVFSEQSIVELSGISIGDRLLSLDTDEAAQGIASNPYIEVNSIKRELSGAVLIRITERKPAAAVMALDTAIIIDKAGHVLELMPSGMAGALLSVRGLNLAGYQINEKLSAPDNFQVSSMLEIVDALAARELEKVLSVDMSNPLNVQLIMDTGLIISLGQPEDLDEKLDMAQKVLPELVKLERTEGVLNLSIKGNAIHTPKATPAPQPQESTQGDGADEGDGDDEGGDDGESQQPQ